MSKLPGDSPATVRKPKKGRAPLKGMWKHKKTGGWYWRKMENGKRKVVSLETKDESEALKKAVLLATDPDINQLIGLPSDLEKEIADYIAAKESQNEIVRFSKTQRRIILGQFAKWAGHIPVEKITPEVAAKFYAWQQGRISERTNRPLKEVTIQSYIVSIIGPFFEWLRANRKIAKNPFRGLPMRKLKISESIRERFCDAELRAKILAESLRIPPDVLPADTARYIAFALHVGFEGGFRKNEIIEARPSWINLSVGSLRVVPTDTFTPKTGEKRTVPLSPRLKTFLTEYLQHLPDDAIWCIAPKVQRGKSDYRYDFERPYSTAMEHIGKVLKQDLSWVTPHILRHTFASLRAINGVSLFKISKWIGDSLRTTERHYAHLQPSDSDVDIDEPSKVRRPSRSKKR